MRILITGAAGFIGRHCTAALAAAGHTIICGVREPRARAYPSACEHMALDFTRDFEEATWRERLRGIDIVINTVGILAERPGQQFDAIHVRAPCALFAACAAAHVRIVNISALGADEHAQSRYHLSKKAADDRLLSLDPTAVVLQPSLVYGDDGASARMFTMLASLPVIPLPGAGTQPIQPIHIDDLTAALVAVVENTRWVGFRIPLVGPEPITFRLFLTELRLAMGMGKPRFCPIPTPAMGALARLGGWVRSNFFNPDTWQMLQRGNVAAADATRALLGRPPRAVADFVRPAQKECARRTAKLAWLLPLLRLSVAVVWIVAGVVSFGIYPVEDSLALVARTGVPPTFAPALLYSAAAIDLALGIGTLVLRRRRLLWLAQAAVIIAYTLLITIGLPEFWLHPYGPVVKNIPLLAAIYLLYEMEPRWTT